MLRIANPPLVFDKFIENLLKYSKKTGRPIFFSFEQIYRIFQLFGLEEIYPETFNKIGASLQWKIISLDWINLQFIDAYRATLLLDTSIETLESISDLYDVLLMLNREAESNQRFEKDLTRILGD